jgi:hypothetical protein
MGQPPLIPKDMMDKGDREIMADHLFQILNPDYRVPPDLCLHVYQTVSVDDVQPDNMFAPLDAPLNIRTTRQCKNCKKYL